MTVNNATVYSTNRAKTRTSRYEAITIKKFTKFREREIKELIRNLF